MWASPNDRIPGVSITQPPKRSGSATDCVDVCRALADSGHLAGRPIRLWHKAIHQRGFADAGVAEQHRHLAGQQRGDGVEGVVAARGGDREVEVGELRGERLRRGEIGLGQTQDRAQPAGVGGDQCALDQAGARRRVGQRHHDEQLVGVGDDDAFGRIGVIGGAPQHRSPLTAPHDAGQRVRCARTGHRRCRRRRRRRSGCGPVRGPASRSRGDRGRGPARIPTGRGRR